MSDSRTDWSQAPQQRRAQRTAQRTSKPTRPAAGTIAAAPVAVIIVALLATAVAGVAVHHPSTPAGFVANPAGFQRLVDHTNHLSLTVPSNWHVPAVTTGALSSEIQALKTTDPQLVPLADIALAALQKVQLGVFAFDAATRTSLFAYGADDPPIRTIDQISAAALVAHLNDLGAKNVQATRVHLPRHLGDAEQVSVQLSVGAATISELLDYVVVHNRVVAIILATRASAAPISLLRQIERSLAPA